MDKARRREIARDFQERKQRRGVFAVRCAATGEVWAASSPNLDAQQNGTWFALRLGSHPNKALQAAWKAHGEGSFSYEVLEVLDDEGLGGMGVDTELKARTAAWRQELGAAAVTG